MAELAERDRFTDEEWALVEKGLCPDVIEYGMVPGRIVHCGKPANRGDWYRCCDEHGAAAREEDEACGIFRPRPGGVR